MNKSENINELSKALIKASMNFVEPKKTAVNHFNKYAPLESIRRAVIKPLLENGLTVVQFPCDGEDGTVSISTMLLHSSGQYIENQVKVKPSKPDPQGVGGAITYLRRYSYVSILGLAPEDEDDDGNAASTPPKSAHVTGKKPAPRALTTASVVFGVSDSDKKLLEEINQLLEVPGLSEDTYKAIEEGLSRASTTSQYQELKKRLLEETNE
ncbi:MAG: ERF family protein [Candidatus Bathyarchaeia archaeon]